jgi:hypothetical protein
MGGKSLGSSIVGGASGLVVGFSFHETFPLLMKFTLSKCFTEATAGRTQRSWKLRSC